MGLREIESKLPPGFRFYPSDEELVCHYLCKKISRERIREGTLVEVDLHTCEPWELPEVAKLNTSEWYFFSFRDRKYSTGSRTNRATKTGYWKATGKDRSVQDPRTQAVVAMRKTLVFYGGRAPNGVKTGWVMHEYRLESPHMPAREDWVLCRVFSKTKAAEAAAFIHNNKHDNHIGQYSSPNIVEYYSPHPVGEQQKVDGYHQLLPPFQTLSFPTQHDDYLARLQPNNFLGHLAPAHGMQYHHRHHGGSSAGYGGDARPDEDDDDYRFLVSVGLGDHGMNEGSSSGHGMGSC